VVASPRMAEELKKKTKDELIEQIMVIENRENKKILRKELLKEVGTLSGLETPKEVNNFFLK
jgi:hypothetical protein